MLLIFVFYLTNIFFGDIVYRCGSAYIRHKYCRDTMSEVCFVQLPIINILSYFFEVVFIFFILSVKVWFQLHGIAVMRAAGWRRAM